MAAGSESRSSTGARGGTHREKARDGLRPGCSLHAWPPFVSNPTVRIETHATRLQLQRRPGTLPEEVLRQAADEMLDWHGTGQSVMEMSHRGKEFMSIAAAAEADLRELLGDSRRLPRALPAGRRIAAVRDDPDEPAPGPGRRRLREHRRMGEEGDQGGQELRRRQRRRQRRGPVVHVRPGAGGLAADRRAAYVHYTANETIGGVEFRWVPDVGDVPLVCDMSSNILSRPVDVTRYGLIYAGAQKNIGPAGLTIVIVRDDLIGLGDPAPPAMLDYATHDKADSMYNTPPTYAIYIAGLVFKWMLATGGLAGAEQRNLAKAALLYDYLDGSRLLRQPGRAADRSRMNVPFTLADPDLDADFLAGAAERGLVQLKGHRSVGGMRASLYNAMPIEGVQALVDYMAEFAATKG